MLKRVVANFALACLDVNGIANALKEIIANGVIISAVTVICLNIVVSFYGASTGSMVFKVVSGYCYLPVAI